MSTASPSPTPSGKIPVPDLPPRPSSRLKRLGWRLYEEILQPSRLDEYRRLLQNARNAR